MANVEVVEQVIEQRTRIAGQAGLRRISIHRIILHSLPLISHTIQNRQLHSAAAIHACRRDVGDCCAAAARWWRTRCVESLVRDKAYFEIGQLHQEAELAHMGNENCCKLSFSNPPE